MSYKSLNQMWEEVHADLQDFLQQDETIRQDFLHKRSKLVSLLQNLYYKCVSMSRRLNTCLDLTRQPQRRALMRTMLDLVLMRLLEIRHEIVSLDATDTLHCDNLINKFKLQPQDLMVTIPTYFLRERLQVITQREQSITECLEKVGGGATGGEVEELLSVSEAVAVIQRHERARQARNKALQTRAQTLLTDRERGRGKAVGAQLTRDEAATRLQAYTRGALARRKVIAIRKEEEIFLGLALSSNLNTDVEKSLERVKMESYKRQEVLAQKLEHFRRKHSNKIIFEEGPEMVQMIQESLREWIFQVKRDTGKFPELPDEDEGGSLSIEGLIDPLADKSRMGESQAIATAPPIYSSSMTQEEQIDEEEEQRVVMKPSLVLDEMKSVCDEYTDVWQSKGVGNVCEDIEERMVGAEQKEQVKSLLRKRVDSAVREQLQKLREEVEGEKKGSRKKKRVKKGSKKKGRRREKDLTPDRTTESLFEELVINGIVKSTANAPELSDLLASVNLVGSRQQDKTGWSAPHYGDFINTLVEYLALPLGLARLHDVISNSTNTDTTNSTLSSAITRSLLLVGTRGCGKTSALMAVCKATGCLLLDLTATNIVGRYPGRAGLTMMLHMVLKVGRLLQPTVILVDEADRTFLKKVPKTDKSEPRRLRKELPRLVRSILPEDQIVLVGITNSPWNCDLKSMNSVYQRMILVPRPTYSERATLLRQELKKQGATVNSSTEVSALARISDGFTANQLCSVVKQVVNIQKTIAPDNTSIAVQDVIPYMAKHEVLYREEEEMLQTWFSKIPLMKKRAKIVEELKVKEKTKATSEKNSKKSKQKKK